MNKILDDKQIRDILSQTSCEDIYKSFDENLGIINAVLERNELKDYGLFMYQSLSADTRILFGHDKDVSSGGLGVNENRESALIACFAEAIERYCMAYCDKEELIYDNLENLPTNHRLKNFHLYTDEQYKKNKDFINPYTNKIHWTKIDNIKDESFVYWPASLIYLPFKYDKRIAETTSTGMAAGSSLEDCVENGLLELIERDALMINFLNRLNPPQINVDSIKNIPLLNNVKKDFRVDVYKLYSDIDVPIYLSYISKEINGKVRYGIGACANFSSSVAIEKSIKECLFTYFYSEHLLKYKQKNPNKIKTLYEHFLYYQGKNFQDLLFNSEISDYHEEITTYKELINSLNNANLSVYYKDITTSDVIDTGMKVVRVIVPGLVDLNKSHLLPRLGADRLWKVPKKLDLNCINDITSMPHPFP